MKAEQREDFWRNPNRTERKKNVPVCSKETNSTAEGGSLDHFDKIPNPQILESFHTWKITYTYFRDPCFTTPLKQLDFFASLLIFFVQSLFSLSEDLLQKKITVLVTIDTAPDKLEGNLYTPAVNFVLTMCQTEECCKSLHILDICILAYGSISSNRSQTNQLREKISYIYLYYLC